MIKKKRRVKKNPNIDEIPLTISEIINLKNEFVYTLITGDQVAFSRIL